MSGPWLWLSVPLAPLLGAAAVMQWRDRTPPWLWLTAVPALIAAAWPTQPLPLPELWPGATLGSHDLLTRSWLAFSAALWGLASIYAANSHRSDPERRRFWLFWLLSFSGNLLLIVAQDGASFYVGFTVMSLSAYGLVIHYGGPAPRQAGRLYLQLAVLGEMLLYAALLMRVSETGGAMSFSAWSTLPVGGLTLGLIIIGFGLKAGFWPLHVWLPLAHPAAPAAASAVLSGAMIKAGILGIWRFTPAEGVISLQWTHLLMSVGLFSAFYGIVAGLLQHKSKAALAYSSISQIGYLLIVLAMAWQQPAAALLLALYAVHHGFSKGALFLGAGLTEKYRLGFVHWLFMTLPALALCGFVVTSGAAIKSLLKHSFSHTAFGDWKFVLTLGAMATTALLVRALCLMHKASQKQTAKPPWSMVLPWVTLCLAPVLLPWFWQPMREAWESTLKLAKVWQLFWPVCVAAGISLIVLKLRPLNRHRKLPNPAKAVSTYIKRRLHGIPPLGLSPHHINRVSWRQWERRWNRFWKEDPVTASTWLLCLLLLFAWFV